MGVRADKGRALSRYITGHTGMPLLHWNGTTIESPPPYKFEVTTSRSLENWHNLIRGIEGYNPHMAIRYDNTLPDVSHAWVAMQLSGFVPLLTAHYKSIQDRIKGE
jgi:hypothetical protein